MSVAAGYMLLVEDNPDDINLIRRAIRKAGVDTPYEIVTDGEQAIAHLERAPTDASPLRLVLLDLKLPRRSGFEVLTWIKAQPRIRRVPVVILTSSDASNDLARAYDLGANSYLVKPAAPAALTAVIAQIDAYWLQLNRLAR